MARPRSIVSLDEGAELATINMLVYSHPGEGKTVLWGSGGEGVLIMDSDHGTESAMAQGSKADRAPVTDYDELVELYEFLKNDNAKEPKPYRWVVWDSLSLFQNRSLIDEIMVDAVADNPKQEEFVPSMRQYLIGMNRVGRMVRNFVDLPINFGVSCHVMQEQDPTHGTTYVPAVQGKGMPGTVSGYMNVVGYLGKQEVEGKMTQRLWTMRNGRYAAKDRFDALGRWVDKPTLPKIETAIDAKRKAIAAASKASAEASKPTTTARRRRAIK